MKFSCTQENLNLGLIVVSHIANKNVNLPILGNILMRCDDSGLHIMSTNLEIAIRCHVRGKVEEPGEFTLPSKLCSDYIGLLPKERVDLTKDGNTIIVSCGTYQTRLNGVDASEFPLIPTLDRKQKFTVKVNDLRKAIGQTLFAVAPNESRPEISGVLFRFAPGEGSVSILILAATDSYRLAEKIIPVLADTQLSDALSVIVPARTVSELTRILGLFKDSVERSEEVEIFINDNQILFVFDSVELISRTIEGKYPDYKQLIPDSFETQIVVNKDDLYRAVKTTSLFSRTGLHDIRLTFSSNGNVKISAMNSQTGEQTVDLDGDINGKENDITVNFKYFLDGLGNLETDDVLIQMIDGVSPCLLRPKISGDASARADYLYIVMPIRQ